MKKLIPQSLKNWLGRRFFFLNQFVDYFYYLISLNDSQGYPQFIIVGQGRTGSTLLTSLFDSHPDILCQGELLGNDWKESYRNILFVEAFILGRAYRNRAKVFGFKMKFDHLFRHQNYKDTSSFMQLLSDKGWKVIYLRRNNLFYHSLSQLVAEKHNRAYHHRSGEGKLSRKPVEIDRESLMYKIKKSEGNQATALEFLKGIDFHEVIYERDLMDPEHQKATMNSLYEYVGVRPHEASTNMVKINARPLESIITNVEEVKEFMAETPYAIYMDKDIY
ncbi:MAG: hypothetical protein AAFY71_08705 [Bacteroidota bacterium]